MNCALWLNKRKVRIASEISDNLDVAALRGYFLAGSLVPWLCENGGESYAEKLSGLSADDPELNDKIARIFGGKPAKSKPLPTASGTDTPRSVDGHAVSSAMQSYRPTSGGLFGSFGSFGLLELAGYGSVSGSFEFSRFWSGGAFGSLSYLELSSFGEFMKLFGSGGLGSYNLGSYSQWEWLFRWFWQGYGSFNMGSFSSFHEWEWEWLFRLFASRGSFTFSSLSGLGSFSQLWSALFGGFGSFVNFGSFGSFAFPEQFPVMDEYDRVMFETLIRCPLDRFGYGVHNI